MSQIVEDVIAEMRQTRTINDLKEVFEHSKNLMLSKDDFLKINTYKNHRKEELLLPF